MVTKSSFFNQLGKNFFFNDPFEMGQFALRNFPDDCEMTIKKADNVIAQRFQFNLRWDLEKTEDFVIFEDEIDWLKQPGNDPEWVFAFNRMTFWGCLGKAYAITKDEKYPKTFVRQLRHWLKTVPQADNAAWRSIEVGFRMEYWLKAFRYFEHSPEITDEVTGLFYDSIINHAEFLMALWNPYNLMSNWGILANHGLFLAGAMLPQSVRTEEYIKKAIERLSLTLKMQVYRDGTHWEQSPMYHNEMLKCFLDVVSLAKRTNIKLPDFIINKTYDMCRYCLHSAKPNHCELSMGDSDDIDVRDLITRAAAIFSDGEFKSRSYSSPDYDSIWDMGEIGIKEFNNISTDIPKETDMAFSDSNNYFFRSGWDETSTFVHFHCGTLGAGHGHADKLHVDIFSRGEDILADSGRFTYVCGKDRIRYKEAKAHNVIMVDNCDYYVCKDSWECFDLTRGINQKFFSTPEYGYAEGGHLAYISKGIFINRRVIYIKPDIIILADEIYAKDNHLYNQFFKFGSSGTLTGTENYYTYKSNKVRTDVIMLADGLSVKTYESYISQHYNSEEKCSVLETSFKGFGFTSAFTVFAISDGDDNRGNDPNSNPKILTVIKPDVKSTFKGINFDKNKIEALTITHRKKCYTVVVAHEEFASPTDTFEADGCLGFGSCVIFNRTNNETQIGTVLQW